jgi:hypothetical protein
LAQKIDVEIMNKLFHSPSAEDLSHLLKAWRFWLLMAIAGALISTAVYYAAPPPYRAKATVNVDFNLEEAWPDDIDRQQFYYLERESRKLEEIAWSDDVLKTVSDSSGISVSELRDEVLMLSQPAEAGWHFYAENKDRQLAAKMASTWAKAFTETARAQIGATDGLNSFIKLDDTQTADLPVKHSVPLSSYLIFGVLAAMLLGAFGVLFFEPQSQPVPAKKIVKKKK